MAKQESDSLANTVACGLVVTAAASIGTFALETLVLPERPYSVAGQHEIVADRTGDESILKPFVAPPSFYFPMVTAIGVAVTFGFALYSANENDQL
jgi:hypothetical protein